MVPLTDLPVKTCIVKLKTISCQLCEIMITTMIEKYLMLKNIRNLN